MNDDPPLPKQWPDYVRLDIVNAVALAYTAFTVMCATASGGGEVASLRAEVARLRSELALSQRELDLLHTRFARLNPRNRPHYRPEKGLDALLLRAARGWTLEQLAKRLLLAERMRERPAPPEPPETKEKPLPKPKKVVTAKYPNHLWNVDVTTVPPALGMWAPWFPFALPNVWPFAWHVVFVLDHFSRKVLAFRVTRRNPSEKDVCKVLNEAARCAGAPPKHIVTDQGSHFQSEFRAWCARNGVAQRYGAIGQHGSIALIERFHRSFKEEAIRWLVVPFEYRAMTLDVQCYVDWYNTHRPHQALDGRTPDEVFSKLPSARAAPRYEPRRRYPLQCSPAKAAPKNVRGRRGVKLCVVVDHEQGCEHLPIVSLRRAA